jgi:hypothetical protein
MRACNGGEKIKVNRLFQAVFLDLGQSDNGANPDGWAKEQPLKTLRAADTVLLECSEENESACSGMKWSGKQTNERSGMKRYCGCISPTERRKRPCGDEERNSAKKIAAYFQAAVFFGTVKCLWNGGRRLFRRRPTGTAERNKGNDRRETA